MRSPLDRALRGLMFGAVVGQVAAIAWALALLFRSWLDAPPVVSPLLAAVLCLAAKPLLARIERWATGASHGTAASVMTAGFAPVFAWAAHDAFATPVIRIVRESEGVGLGATLGIGAALLLLGVTFGTIGALSRGQLGRMRDRVLTFFGIGALGFGACLTIWASFRLVTHPDLEAYLGAEPVAVFVPQDQEPLTPSASARLVIILPILEPHDGQALFKPYVDEIRLDNQTVFRRQCQEDACSVELHFRVDDPGAPSPDRTAAEFLAPVRLHAYTRPSTQFWVVESGERSAIFDVDTHRAAFDVHTLERVDVSALDLAGSIAPPPLLVFASLLGIALAWLTLAWRGALIERMVALDSAREAFLDERGWLAFTDGSPPSRAVAPLPPPGPVLVLAPRKAGADTYRSASRLEEQAPLLPGTRADARAEIDAAIAGRFATALAAIAVLSAPLAVVALATFLGRVFG